MDAHATEARVELVAKHSRRASLTRHLSSASLRWDSCELWQKCWRDQTHADREPTRSIHAAQTIAVSGVELYAIPNGPVPETDLKMRTPVFLLKNFGNEEQPRVKLQFPSNAPRQPVSSFTFWALRTDVRM